MFQNLFKLKEKSNIEKSVTKSVKAVKLQLFRTSNKDLDSLVGSIFEVNVDSLKKGNIVQFKDINGKGFKTGIKSIKELDYVFNFGSFQERNGYSIPNFPTWIELNNKYEFMLIEEIRG